MCLWGRLFPLRFTHKILFSFPGVAFSAVAKTFYLTWQAHTAGNLIPKVSSVLFDFIPVFPKGTLWQRTCALITPFQGNLQTQRIPYFTISVCLLHIPSGKAATPSKSSFNLPVAFSETQIIPLPVGCGCYENIPPVGAKFQFPAVSAPA